MAKFDLSFATAYQNASGSLGFIPPADHPDVARLGAFVTNPISLKPRSATRSPLVIRYPGGFLLHTGYPNPGLRMAMQRFAPHWSRMEIPVIVHLLCIRVSDLPEMINRLEKVSGIIAIELGLPPQIEPDMLLSLAQAVVGELPIIMRIPLDQVNGLIDKLALLAGEHGIAAFSLGPPRGVLPGGTNRLVHGRLYGPGIFPFAMAALHRLAALKVPVIGGGGVYSLEQAEVMLAAGALAVQFDAVLWRGSISEK
jgi:dihydroorotate dehydrogenase